MEELLAKIHGHAYWRVLIRPSEFAAKRILSLGQCEQIVKSSQVVLRGWDYPHIERIRKGHEWIESGCDWDSGPHYEYWRLYQSGQFVHHFSCVEEFHRLSWSSASPKYLLVLNALYTVTEVFEFAARLAGHEALGRAAQLDIQLHGMRERVLTFQDMGRAIPFAVHGLHESSLDVVKYQVEIPVAQLLAAAPDAALTAAIAIFERFDWMSPSRKMLAADQRKFVERGLGVGS